MFMENLLTAYEMSGTIDENRQLRLDGLLPVTGPMRVRVIIMYPIIDEFTEADWLNAAAHNPAFADLYAPEEDIYTPSDGIPFNEDKG
jgi:hypothetical protein